ncbi:substrate-binding periplasmic protein [Pseudobacteriovorax antillogorgiicola]|uniref:ABC-type amino acid transport substrate-binding protein n=1 Tax=Pseudobacteriovorax antillogorgiicola TaxID=1513793 RepID=A0A1Y6BMG6_9BACT|nr:transporter substrate-binding domain-containing protein [Pseudobacteriovorax antillogorgiicola]TCS54500.1 ABC-type amino acid transport substrate-binding protein [Pseudobacteriovorax antillogorgiicola]SMF19034.1 ABC-type amino acid transport substrate-binding protein [Pseudobacteriovorax antillogorgiicola]
MNAQICKLLIVFQILLASEWQVLGKAQKDLGDRDYVAVMISNSTPPYVFFEERNGIVIDVIDRAFSYAGVKTQFLYASNLRILKELNHRSIDAAFASPGDASTHKSDPVIHYRNVVVTKSSFIRDIKKMEDLSTINLAAFQNASRFHKGLADAIAKNPGYFEVTNQKTQVPLLMAGRVEAILLEEKIFHYYRIQSAFDEKHFKVHFLFDKAPRFLYFVDEKLRDSFNQGLKKLRETGEIPKIVSQYLKKYQL